MLVKALDGLAAKKGVIDDSLYVSSSAGSCVGNRVLCVME